LRLLGLLFARKGAVRSSPSDRNIWRAAAGPKERFLVAAGADAFKPGTETVQVSGFADFPALSRFFRENPQAIASVVVDLKRVVDQICDLAPMPLLTVVHESSEQDRE
jgi:hypothetical protein